MKKQFMSVQVFKDGDLKFATSQIAPSSVMAVLELYHEVGTEISIKFEEIDVTPAE